MRCSAGHRVQVAIECPRGTGRRAWVVRRHSHGMDIRIISTPPGEAPEHVRAAWIGLTLPAAVSRAVQLIL